MIRHPLGDLELLLDDTDAWVLDAGGWYAWHSRDTWYAARNYSKPDGSRDVQYLHRVLMRPAVGQLVDHINRNGLDNQRANLRLSTTSQNLANRPAPRHNRSGFKGVSWDKRRQKYTAQITVDGRKRHLGYFTEAQDAASAYNAAALDVWGDFALLNQ